MNTEDFLTAIKKKRQALRKMQKQVQETDQKRSETLIRKIELCNIMIAEFQPQTNTRSLKNLNLRAKF
jgi:hypothetical protein